MRIAFVATRASGLDGVSLEIDNWQKILTRLGHNVFVVAGELDRAGILIPELHFQSPKVAKIYNWVIESKKKFEDVEVPVFELAGRIEGLLRQSLETAVCLIYWWFLMYFLYLFIFHWRLLWQDLLKNIKSLL